MLVSSSAKIVLPPLRSIIALVLMWLMSSGRAYGDEISTCAEVRGLAYGQVSELCGCSVDTCQPCNYIAYGSASVVCSNGCQYCAFGVCVVYAGSASRSDETAAGLSLVYVLGFAFTYTKGRSGTFAFSSDGEYCNAFFNNVACSCQMNYCDASLTTAEPFIDCSNIQAGATANLCYPKANYGISSTNHLLIGLIVDVNDPCNAKHPSPVKAPIKAPVKAPAKAPLRAPIKSPMKTPVKPPVKTPAKTPAKTPVKTPLKSPLRAPVKRPIKARPAKSPAKNPTKAPAKKPL